MQHAVAERLSALCDALANFRGRMAAFAADLHRHRVRALATVHVLVSARPCHPEHAVNTNIERSGCFSISRQRGWLQAAEERIRADYRSAATATAPQHADAAPPTPPFPGLLSQIHSAASALSGTRQPLKGAAAQERVAAALAARDAALAALGPPPRPPPAPQGVYICGSVGSGKSLLMDLFFGVAARHVLVPRRRRVHFNAALLEVNMLSLIHI